MKTPKTFILMLLIFMVSLFMSPAAAMAASSAPVKVVALGFFSHPPLQPTKADIEKICQEFGDQVQLVFHDEMTADGEQFMKDNGLSGHLPVVLYVNGSVAHELDGKTVVFRDFEGQGWTGQDLEQVIKLNLAGQKTAVSPPANALTEAWNPGAIPAGASDYMNGQFPGAGNSSPGNQSSLLPIYLMGTIILLLLIVIIIGAVHWRPAARRK